MLQKLDPRKLHALSLEGDVHEEYDFDPFQHFDQIREQITTGTEESNWAWGVAGILRYAGDLCALPRRRRRMTSCEQYRKSDDWWIELLEHDDLRLQPRSGGVVDVILSGRCVGSYQIMGCRRNWPELLKCVWEQCHNFEVVKMKREASKKLRNQGRRVDQPLLHQVLRPGRFKAPQKKKPLAKARVAVSDKADVKMKDPGTLKSAGSDTARPTEMGEGKGHNTLDAKIKDVNIGALEVVDHDR